jgi:hypothetical protein
MNVDHYFAIGAAHAVQGKPCEDYALSGVLPEGRVFGVVADGCSGAKANTDVGARAISWAFKHALEQRWANEDLALGDAFHAQLEDAFSRFQYGLDPADYASTVLGFVATPERACVYAHGDGAVAVSYDDGRTSLIEFTWAGNRPFYLDYQMRPSLLRQFQAHHADLTVHPFCQRTTTFAPTPEGLTVLETSEKRFSVEEVLFGHTLEFSPKEQGIRCLAVLTDGLEQLGSLSTLDATHEFLEFKNFKGQFVKRRMLSALKAFGKEKNGPQDDLGIAAVWFPTSQD